MRWTDSGAAKSRVVQVDSVGNVGIGAAVDSVGNVGVGTANDSVGNVIPREQIPGHTSQEIEDLKRELTLYKEQCRNLAVNFQLRPRTPQAFQCSRPAQGPRALPHRVIYCFVCGRPGHTLHSCRFNRQQLRTALFWAVCKRTGHTARQMPLSFKLAPSAALDQVAEGEHTDPHHVNLNRTFRNIKFNNGLRNVRNNHVDRHCDRNDVKFSGSKPTVMLKLVLNL